MSAGRRDRWSTSGCRPMIAAALIAGVSIATPVVVEAASRPVVRGQGGAVVSDERLATDAGLTILARGGNAVDAAVATALAMVVVGPEAGNLGGGGFAVVRMAGVTDGPTFLDFREVAPAAASRDMYLGEDGQPVAEKSWIGPLAAGVPGSPDGLFTLHRRYGKLPFADVVEPARKLAADGFALSRRTHDSLVEERELLARFPESAAVWLPGGEPVPAGTLKRLPNLARTLQRYAAEGPSAVTEGSIAAAIEAASTRHGGVLTAADLAAYEPVWREPVRFEAFGWQVASANLPSSGGILLGASFQMLERLGVGHHESHSADRAHLLAEVWRRAYADRYLLGDPATTAATADDLLAEAWLGERVTSFSPATATSSDAVRLWSDIDAPEVAESVDTTHLSVIDADGSVVALTTTLNGLFGGGLWVPEAGYFLNNEMDDFAAAPGQPNFYGLVQGEANAVAPGKRMLSSMSPTIAWKTDGAGRTVEVVSAGGRGGSRIPTSTMQIFLGVWVDDVDLQAAVDRPRVHHQWRPDTLFHEPDALSVESRAALVVRGHALDVIDSIAQAHAVRFVVEDGIRWCEAAPDPRGGGGWGGVVEPLY
ncbi:MAG: gamma-glutamyltransferase [Acidobacteriota bacterium]